MRTRPGRDLAQPFHPLQLRDTDRCGKFVEAIVVAKSHVPEPGSAVVTSLVPEASSVAASSGSSVTTTPPSPVVICLLG